MIPYIESRRERSSETASIEAVRNRMGRDRVHPTIEVDINEAKRRGFAEAAIDVLDAGEEGNYPAELRYGGPTVTEAIAAGSPAIDAVPAGGAGCEPTDQRGVLRPAGPACDSGAFELATPTATTLEASGAGTAFATLAGLARNPDLAEASAYFQYGTSTAYGRQTGEQTIEATAAGAPYSAVLNGLAAHMTYHFRAVVTNATGVSFGADQTFTTAALPSTGHTTITTRPPSHSLPLLTPLLRSLSIRPSTLVPERGRGQSITRAKTKRGATVTYSDSQAAVSPFTVQRARCRIPRREDLRGQTAAERPRARARLHALRRGREVHAQRRQGHEQLPLHRARQRSPARPRPLPAERHPSRGLAHRQSRERRFLSRSRLELSASVA